MVKKLKKQYETPEEGWSQERISREDELIEDYGLKNKREVYKAQSQLRNLRREARKLAASENERERQELLKKVNDLGLVRKDTELGDILSLSVTDILDRRLQTVVNRRGLSDTVKHARQLVIHGHVYVDGERITIPGYLLTQEEEKQVEVIIPETTEEEESGEQDAEKEESEEENEESSGEDEETEAEDEEETAESREEDAEAENEEDEEEER